AHVALSPQKGQSFTLPAGDAPGYWSQRLLEASRTGACVLRRLPDNDYEFVHASPGLCRMLRRQIPPGSCLRRLAPQLYEQWYEQLAGVADSGRATLSETRLGGRTRWLAIEITALDGPGSQLLGVMVRNISRRRRREQDE